MRRVRPTELTVRQTEVLLEFYKPIRVLPEFYRRQPNDSAFWLSLDQQREIDPNGRIVARLFNRGLLVERKQKSCKLSAAGLELARLLYRERGVGLALVA